MNTSPIDSRPASVPDKAADDEVGFAEAVARANAGGTVGEIPRLEDAVVEMVMGLILPDIIMETRQRFDQDEES